MEDFEEIEIEVLKDILRSYGIVSNLDKLTKEQLEGLIKDQHSLHNHDGEIIPIEISIEELEERYRKKELLTKRRNSNILLKDDTKSGIIRNLIRELELSRKKPYPRTVKQKLSEKGIKIHDSFLRTIMRKLKKTNLK